MLIAEPLSIASPSLPNLDLAIGSFNRFLPFSEQAQSLILARREAERLAFIRWQEALAKWLSGWQTKEESEFEKRESGDLDGIGSAGELSVEAQHKKHHHSQHHRVTEFEAAAGATLNYIASASSLVATSVMLGFTAAADNVARRIAQVANIKPVVDEFVRFGSQATQRLADARRLMNPVYASSAQPAAQPT